MNLHENNFELTEFGELFEAIQLSNIFPDSKTFNDCIPKFEKEVIIDAYLQQKNLEDFKLESFVDDFFHLTTIDLPEYTSDASKPIDEHIDGLWNVLTRQPDQSRGSLIPLPYPYIVPGGRFQEIYYWDSYFTMLGLQVSRRYDLIESMVENFAYLIKTIGHIPNGNRTYYKSRSQPPFFTLMVQLLQEGIGGHKAIEKYLPYIEKEYHFWMDGAEQLSEETPSYRRVVRLPNGVVLNRYWDKLDTPRPEAFKEDLEIAHLSNNDAKSVFRNLRAAAESGWDFSSRWLADTQNLQSIITTDIIPVDLNCLLFHIEKTLASIYQQLGDIEQHEKYLQKAHIRQKAILAICWNDSQGFFFDYNFIQQTPTSVFSLAGVFPLFFEIASPTQAKLVAERIATDFLKKGGLITTTLQTGQQWDSPNGWAPLHWISYQGLRKYQYIALATNIQERWIATNEKVYQSTGKMTEKYNVVDPDLLGGGGEYPNQDGFGWSNGVLLRLLTE